MNCSTSLNDEKGIYRQMLDMLYWTLMKNKTTVNARINGVFYTNYTSWIRDYVQTQKGLKYYEKDPRSALDPVSYTHLAPF